MCVDVCAQAKLGELAALMSASESQQIALLNGVGQARAHARACANLDTCVHVHARTYMRMRASTQHHARFFSFAAGSVGAEPGPDVAAHSWVACGGLW